MPRVKKKAKSADREAEKFATRIYKVDLEQARLASHYAKILKVDLKHLRIKGHGGRKPFRAVISMQWNTNIKNGLEGSFWKSFDNLATVRLYFTQSYGTESEKVAIEHLGLSRLKWQPPSAQKFGSNAWVIGGDDIKDFRPFYNTLASRFFADAVPAYEWPNGWKSHGANKNPLKVYHKVDAFCLIEDIRKVVDPSEHFASFRLDCKGKSLGIMVKNAKTQGVNMETLELMNKIDKEVKKHRTANNSLHKS